jgi:hypothetical protein
MSIINKDDVVIDFINLARVSDTENRESERHPEVVRIETGLDFLNF